MIYAQSFECPRCGWRVQTLVDIKSDKNLQVYTSQIMNCVPCGSKKQECRVHVEKINGNIFSSEFGKETGTIFCLGRSIISMSGERILINLPELLNCGYTGIIEIPDVRGSIIDSIMLDPTTNKWSRYKRKTRRRS